MIAPGSRIMPRNKRLICIPTRTIYGETGNADIVVLMNSRAPPAVYIAEKHIPPMMTHPIIHESRWVIWQASLIRFQFNRRCTAAHIRLPILPIPAASVGVQMPPKILPKITSTSNPGRITPRKDKKRSFHVGRSFTGIGGQRLG